MRSLSLRFVFVLAIFFTLTLFHTPLFSDYEWLYEMDDWNSSIWDDDDNEEEVEDDNEELHPTPTKHNVHFKASALPTNDDAAAPLANIEGEPSAFVHGCVNVITGQYCEFVTDLIVHHGTDPIRYERSFAGSTGDSRISGGWEGNHQSFVKYVSDNKKCTFGDDCYFKDDHGSKAMWFVLDKGKDKKYELNQPSLYKGVTNTSQGFISGQNNLRNLKINASLTQPNIITGCGDKKIFTHLHKDTRNIYRLQEEKKPNGNKLFYSYHKSGHGYELKQIDLLTPKNRNCGYIEIKSKGNATTNDGRWVSYKTKKSRYKYSSHRSTILNTVTSSDGPKTKYKYRKLNYHLRMVYESIVKKTLPDDRFLDIRYYWEGHNLVMGQYIHLSGLNHHMGRVKSLYAPAGTDKTPVPIYQFMYDLHVENNPFTGEPILKQGSCHVFNALGYRTQYGFDENQRLMCINKFDANGGLETHERLFWGDNESKENTCLKARDVVHGAGTLFARGYQYDDSGNVLIDSIYGNLTGNNFASPQVFPDGTIIDNGCDCFSKHQNYTDDGLNLLWRKHDGRLFTEYAYEPKSNRVAAKYEGDGTNGVPSKWLRRTFYSYNEDAALVKEVSDDGSGKDVNDLTDVTERNIIYFTQSKTYPAAFPLVIEEKCLDLASGQEKLVHKVVNKFTNLAKISSQEHYDCNGDHAYTLLWEYDRMGNVTKEVNAIGQSTVRRYDENSNCLSEMLMGQPCYKHFFYDYMNRLIKEDDFHLDGQSSRISHRYDVAGNKIATVDENGNETLFKHDAFGRITEIVHPNVLNEDGVVCTPTTKKEYNPLSKVTKEINSLGEVIKMSYNIRGQLVETVYPDGTSEKNTYNLDGSLAESKAKNKVVTKYFYDCFKRPIRVDIVDENGSLLSTSSLAYNNLHLISETDPAGIVSSYTYFPDGKLQSKTKGDYSISYFYDALGRQNKTVEQYGPNPEDVIVKAQEYDLLNRVTSDSMLDANNAVISKVDYTYDAVGNVNQTTNYTQADTRITQYIYNSNGLLTTVIDAEGNKTVTTRKYDYRNSLGQIVGYQETTDPLGNISITICDVFGRVTTKMRKNAFGKIIQKQELAYDLNGNVRKITDTVINGQDADQEIVSIMHYDSCNRLTACYEAYGTPEQKVTKIAYNSFGQKENLTKNDGVSISYTYDALGRIKSQQSSDGTIDYAYEYDANSNPIRVEDLAGDKATVRSYDGNGFMVQEVQGNDLSTVYSYDYTGRVKEMVLSDQTKIGYAYHANRVKTVSRLDAQNQTLYSHQYDAYDLSGNLTNSTLIKSAGTLSYNYDVKGRLKGASVDGNRWSEQIKAYDSIGNILGISLQDSLGKTSSSYTYDDLYQITSESGPADHTYNHDSHYNRRTKNGKIHILNPLHQLIDDGTSQYSYDRNGNLKEIKSEEQTSAFEYDALDRLISFVKDGQKVLYGYDENNRRLSKTFFNLDESGQWQENETVRYLYQGQNEIGSVDKNGKINELRVLGLGRGAEIGAAVALEIAQKIYVPIHDHIGNVACLLDGVTGDVVETYRYSTFGEEQFDGAGAISPWRFASKRVDEESGLVYFGRRYYSPETGRWISCDPIGREGGVNLYAYVMNSPLTHFDSYGLFGMDSVLHGFAYVADKVFQGGAKLFSWGVRAAGDAVSFIGRDILPVPYVNHLVEFGGYCLRGENPLTYDWSKHKSQVLVHHGNRNRSDHIFVNFNGICTNRDEHQKRLGQISEANGGVTVYGMHTAYNGIILDALEYACQKVGIPTLGQITANREVTKLLAQQGVHVGSTTVYASAHSRGTETVYHLNGNSRKIMDMTGYGSARITPKEHYRSSRHYTCGMDVVPWLCPYEYIKGRSNGRVTVLPTSWNPGADHYYDNPLFEKERQRNGMLYQQEFKQAA